MFRNTQNVLALYSCLFLFTLQSCTGLETKSNDLSNIEHVLIIGVDGLNVRGIKKVNTPTLDRIMANGAYSLSARGVIPTSSGPNWASILMGAGPGEHGVTNNSYDPTEPELPPSVSGNGNLGIFPSVFEVLHRAKPDWEIGAIYHWSKIRNYFEEDHIDFYEDSKGDEEVIISAKKYLKEKQPRYCFLHLDDVDHAGHSFGHDSAEYYKAVEKIDTLIGDLTHFLAKNQLDEKTLIIIIADHGGLGFGHNDNVPEVIDVPFILSGPGVKKGYQIVEPVSSMDVSPTSLFALGVEQPYVWRGRPVKSGFVGFEPNTLFAKREFSRQPRFSHKKDDYIPAGGLFVNEKPVVGIDTMEDSNTPIHYTINGEEPTHESPLFTNSFSVDETTVVKAAKFKGADKTSNTNTAFYRIVNEENNLGVTASIYYGKNLEKLPDFNQMKPVLPNFHMYEFTSRGLEYPKGADQVAVTFTSYIKVEKAGEYTFYTESDDGSKLFVDKKEVVDSDGNHGVKSVEGSVYLTKGKHKIEVQWYNSGGGLWLQTYVKGPDGVRQVLTSQMPKIGLSLHKN